MIPANNYLREVRKFASSQYWYSGLRITAGVMVPLLVLVRADHVAEGIPFLWGSLFVSLTDTPGPIHHRRNGMLAATALNTLLVALTGFAHGFQPLLVFEIIAAAFVLTMAGVFGSRAGAVGSLALVVTLLTLLSIREEGDPVVDALLIAGGGLWYSGFSLWLYRLRPYRPVEQALGESLIATADYLRARASLYTASDLRGAFHRVMTEQGRVQRLQDQCKELLFKTRSFVSDPSPRSRSMMMIYLESLDLFEQIMQSYYDYDELRETLSGTSVATRLYGLILQLAAAFEHVGLAVQRGRVIRNDLDFNRQVSDVREFLRIVNAGPPSTRMVASLQVVEKILDNVGDIANGLNKIILYTRAETEPGRLRKAIERSGVKAMAQPITAEVFIKNLTLKSNTFRHALRLTIAIGVGYGVAIAFSVTHPYWLLLTIVTIMRPVYSVSRKRNISRVLGTLAGVVLVFGLLYFVDSPAVLAIIMLLSMLIGYSLLRLNYFGFVVFLTVFVVISFHFLNPVEFDTMIKERLIDTLIGSVLAFLASRFVFPSWEHEAIRASMKKVMEANRRYFMAAWRALKTGNTATSDYQVPRQDAVVALTNLSNSFQSMLAEPNPSESSAFVHQFVIANHMLTGHIAGLSAESLEHEEAESLERMIAAIDQRFDVVIRRLNGESIPAPATRAPGPMRHQTLNQLSMVFSLLKEITRITENLHATGDVQAPAATV